MPELRFLLSWMQGKIRRRIDELSKRRNKLDHDRQQYDDDVYTLLLEMEQYLVYFEHEGR
jgi:hypothetical protein